MKNISILFILIILSSCAQINKNGYSFELSDYKNLKEKINDKNDTLTAMGYPTIEENFAGNDFWIYYSEDAEKLLFFKPKILEREIFVIAFDRSQKIKEINNYSLKDESSFAFIDNYASVLDQNKVSWWKEIFNNIGKIRPN